ncbi:uncharacterized protein sS8_0860 [Methylocaldum marinum]|uniref:Uncharacterized protein n=1 Tax=Methylocaldum marinum TaxID=1432792 RepID=A0A250KMG1_9GAMM|nr:hypothetical protein [Methylocaldum marinum]BBA31978.1 uncharacterized protein sS8_0008 [Methylocaldum marinum]BBA32825.1 uncharacterized protein sS8_0860 [Methylocaldum marinum]
MSEPKYVFFDRTESLMESILKDAATFGFLLLCIYVSRDSAWWTFATGTMAVLMIGTKAHLASNRAFKFRTTAEIKAWAESLPE